MKKNLKYNIYICSDNKETSKINSHVPFIFLASAPISAGHSMRSGFDHLEFFKKFSKFHILMHASWFMHTSWFICNEHTMIEETNFLLNSASSFHSYRTIAPHQSFCSHTFPLAQYKSVQSCRYYSKRKHCYWNGCTSLQYVWFFFHRSRTECSKFDAFQWYFPAAPCTFLFSLFHAIWSLNAEGTYEIRLYFTVLLQIQRDLPK